MRKILYLAILVFFSQCGPTAKVSKGQQAFFSDLDIFKLEGQGPITENKAIPPCFEIDPTGADKKVLTVWRSSQDKYSRTYARENDVWKTTYPLQADTLQLIAISYIGPHKIVTLQYQDDSERNHLKMAVIREDSVEHIYLLKNGLKISPSYDIDPEGRELEKSIEGRGITEYAIRGGQLRVVSTAVNSADAPRTDTSYHAIGNHSIFWWENFGLQQHN